MKKSLVQRKIKGFSMIELLVFITILSLFFIAAMSVLTFSLRNMKVNEHKILASHYAEEALEWIRSEKEINWLDFSAKDTGLGASTYCLNSLNWSSPSSCASYSLNSIFKREAVLENEPDSVSPTHIKVTINISWIDLGQEYSASLKSVLTIIE